MLLSVEVTVFVLPAVCWDHMCEEKCDLQFFHSLLDIKLWTLCASDDGF